MKWRFFLQVVCTFCFTLERAYAWSPSVSISPEGLDIKGFINTETGQQVYPQNNFLYSDHNDIHWANNLRLIVNSDLGSNKHFELNILESIQSQPPIQRALSNNSSNTGRSAALRWEQHNSTNSSAELNFDTFYFQLQNPSLDLSIGRQPINLASTFYFTPNDFFEPFAAQAFYRAYKGGVDAVRAEISLEDFSQLTLLAVLSYDYKSTNEWSHGPDWSETSFLARFTRNSDLFEWSILTGSVQNYAIIGGSFQGELYNWLGIRAEGHFGEPETGSLKEYAQIAAGIEHLHDNSIFWRMEYFYNNRDFSSIQEASQQMQNGLATGYSGKQYAALGVSYEFTPLLAGNSLAMFNLIDNSQLFSVNFVYSTSDESEVSATFALPHGDKPDLHQLHSEFGSQPRTLSLAYRIYF